LLQVGYLNTLIYEKHDVCTLASGYRNAITLFGDAHLFRDHANSFPTPPILPKIMARRIALVKKILAVVWATLGLDLGNGGTFFSSRYDF